MGQHALDLGRQGVGIGKIDDPDRPAPDLVLVGRPDTTLGGADLQAGIGGLAEMIQLPVERQDQRGVVGDPQGRGGDLHTLGLDPVDLVHEMPGIDHDAVADDRELAAADHARRQQRQLVGDAVDDERMAGIMPALKPDDDVGLLGEPVDDLALAFVAPLRPQRRRWPCLPAYPRRKPGRRRPRVQAAHVVCRFRDPASEIKQDTARATRSAVRR